MQNKGDEWRTPQDLFDALDREFHFHVDVACRGSNCLCPFGIDVRYGSSLDVDWLDSAAHSIVLHEKPRTNLMSPWVPNPSLWMNPPYSRGNIDKFCEKAYEESQNGCTVVGLLPLRSASWFHKYVMKAHEIRFLTRRVKFIDPETGKPSKGSPNFDSIIVVWKPGHVDAPKVSSYEW